MATESPPSQASAQAPAVAVIGLPELPAALLRCGYECLAVDGDTSASAVAAAARQATATGRPYVVIVAGDDPALRSWVQVQVAQGRPVLVATSEQCPFGDPIPKTRTISLPATVDEIMAVFGAPPAGGAAGGTVVLSDGSVFVEPPPEPDAAPTSAADPDDPFAQPLFGTPPPVAQPSPMPNAGTLPSTGKSLSPDSASSDNDFEAPLSAASSVPSPPGAIPKPANPFVAPPVQPGAIDGDGVPFPAPSSSSTPVSVPGDLSGPVSEPVSAAGPNSERPLDAPSPAFGTPNTENHLVTGGVVPSETVPRLSQSAPNYTGESPFHVDTDVVIPPPPDLTGLFTAPEDIDVFRPVVHQRHAERKMAPVIIVFAGKGGVGKTTTAFALAERAAVVGGLQRVVLIDINRGQGDVRQYARISGHVPSIYDAAISGDVKTAIVSPSQLAAARSGQPPLHLAVVLAPTADQADASIVTSSVYGAAIDYARSTADLVVIDTQIVEAEDTSGLIDEVVIPLLARDAWGLGLSDTSRPGVSNLLARLKLFQSRGVDASRMMIGLNRVKDDSSINPQAVTQLTAPYGAWVGSVNESPVVTTAFEFGDVGQVAEASSDVDMAALLNRVLSRVTGLNAFDEQPVDLTPIPQKKRGRLRRRPRS